MDNLKDTDIVQYFIGKSLIIIKSIIIIILLLLYIYYI